MKGGGWAARASAAGTHSGVDADCFAGGGGRRRARLGGACWRGVSQIRGRGARPHVNLKGLAGVARVPADARDPARRLRWRAGSGRAMAMDLNSWKKSRDGSYTGTLLMVPDRG